MRLSRIFLFITTASGAALYTETKRSPAAQVDGIQIQFARDTSPEDVNTLRDDFGYEFNDKYGVNKILWRTEFEIKDLDVYGLRQGFLTTLQIVDATTKQLQEAESWLQERKEKNALLPKMHKVELRKIDANVPRRPDTLSAQSSYPEGTPRFTHIQLEWIPQISNTEFRWLSRTLKRLEESSTLKKDQIQRNYGEIDSSTLTLHDEKGGLDKLVDSLWRKPVRSTPNWSRVEVDSKGNRIGPLVIQPPKDREYVFVNDGANNFGMN